LVFPPPRDGVHPYRSPLGEVTRTSIGTVNPVVHAE
jgi:hypothetical protein